MQHSCKTSMFHLFFLLSNQGYTQLFKKNLISLLNSIEALTKFSWQRILLVQNITSLCTTWKCSYSEFFWSVFSSMLSEFLHIHPDAEKCRPEKIRIWTLFAEWWALFLLQKYYLFYFELIHIGSKRLPVFHIEIADSIVIWLLVSSVVSGRSRSILYVKFAGWLLTFLVGQCDELHV